MASPSPTPPRRGRGSRGSSSSRPSRSDKGKSIVIDSSPPPPTMRPPRPPPPQMFQDLSGISAPPAYNNDFWTDESNVDENLNNDVMESIFVVAEEENQEQEQSQPMGRAPRAPSKLRSTIFSIHYTKVDDVEAGPGNFKANCNYCPLHYKMRKGGGYGSLKTHLERCHPDKLGMDCTQTQLRGFTPSSAQGSDSNSPLFKYSEVNMRRNLAKFIAVKSLPFNFADNEFYEDFAKLSLNPAAKKVSRHTVQRDVAKLVGEIKLDVVNIFSKMFLKVSICSDIWSDHWQENSYMGVTVHWIDDSWTMQKRIIGYREFNVEHNAKNIAKIIHTILSEFGLVTKIFSVGFDNASANTASLNDLVRICQPSLGGKFFHVRCICHILNLCVQDGLKVMKSEIAPIKQAIKILRNSSYLTKKWGKYCHSVGKHAKRFCLDVPTRWGSTYNLLNDSYEYRDELCAFFTLESPDICLLPTQWDSCVSLCGLLRVFYEATEKLSGTYYPTSCLVLDHCLEIVTQFDALRNDPHLQYSIQEMIKKWVKYFRNIPEVFLIAKMLDPRIRFDGLEELLEIYYEALYPNDAELNVENEEGNENELTPKPSDVAVKVKNSLCELYKEYKIYYGGNDGDDDDSNFIDEGAENKQQTKLMKKLKGFYKSRSTKRQKGGNPYQEVENFMQATFEPIDAGDPNFNLLEWWSRRSIQFPILSVIAKEIFAVPASTVSVEQAFSQGGYTLDDTRSRLTPEHLEQLTLLQDWVKAEKRAQENQWDDPQDNESITTGTESSNEG